MSGPQQPPHPMIAEAIAQMQATLQLLRIVFSNLQALHVQAANLHADLITQTETITAIGHRLSHTIDGLTQGDVTPYSPR